MAQKLVQLQKLIYEIREQKVMLDRDLADLYEVETFNLNKAVKRNIERFPEDFMFQLTKTEWENLIFQNGISSTQHGGRRFMPYVLTKNDTNQQIAELRKLLMVYIENTDYKLSKHDKAIEQIIIALNNLVEKPPKTKTIGFKTGNWKVEEKYMPQDRLMTVDKEETIWTQLKKSNAQNAGQKLM